jgi:3-oxoacyl-[acyl-carrier protein] reductase
MEKSKSLQELISLEGKKTLITGAAAGLGRAMAYRFAEAGSDLCLVDLNMPKLKEMKDELRCDGVDVQLYKADLSKKAQISNLWRKFNENNCPDILINNAGIYPFKDFIDVDEKLYRKSMDINLDSVFWMSQYFVKKKKKKGGTIINIGSIEAFLPFKKDLAHYSASKAGVIALTRALAREHGSDNYKINCIIPGGIATEGTKKAAMGIFKFQGGLVSAAIDFKKRLALERLGEPDEVAKMALVLASDFSSYMQGALVAVDGGFLST